MKLVDEISLNFPELFITGKYVKIRFKNYFYGVFHAQTDLHNKYMI